MKLINSCMDDRFSILNAGWASLTRQELSDMRRAIREYRREHPTCEMTGTDKKCQVHHIIPIWKAPHLAADKDNLITLSAGSHIHLIYGHAGNFQRRYVANIREIAKKSLALHKELDIVHRTNEEFNAQTNTRFSFFKRIYEKLYGLWLDFYLR